LDANAEPALQGTARIFYLPGKIQAGAVSVSIAASMENQTIHLEMRER
jgi:hypothetical protein